MSATPKKTYEYLLLGLNQAPKRVKADNLCQAAEAARLDLGDSQDKFVRLRVRKVGEKKWTWFRVQIAVVAWRSRAFNFPDWSPPARRRS